MPFVKINISEENEKEKCSSSEFKKAWDESREEYRLIEEMIKLRKQEKITQSRLSKIINV